jgi:hypothetical protein
MNNKVTAAYGITDEVRRALICRARKRSGSSMSLVMISRKDLASLAPPIARHRCSLACQTNCGRLGEADAKIVHETASAV